MFPCYRSKMWNRLSVLLFFSIWDGTTPRDHSWNWRPAQQGSGIGYEFPNRHGYKSYARHVHGYKQSFSRNSLLSITQCHVKSTVKKSEFYGISNWVIYQRFSHDTVISRWRYSQIWAWYNMSSSSLVLPDFLNYLQKLYSLQIMWLLRCPLLICLLDLNNVHIRFQKRWGLFTLAVYSN